MEIVDTAKFAIGILFAILGIGILLSSRRTRGFGQRRQAGVLLVLAAILFVAIGVGLIEI